MKSFIRISMLFLLVFAGMQMSVQKASAQTYVSFQVFYDDLSPYGDWIETPNYGYVWVPNVAPGFSPYGTNGYWVYTEYGWTWVSTYAWGWAPFHYGRWPPGKVPVRVVFSRIPSMSTNTWAPPRP